MEQIQESILYLSLKKAPFEVMVTGEKPREYRKTGDWIKSRLIHKNGTQKVYGIVHFTNGYGPDKPFFQATYQGCYLSTVNETITYSNGLVVDIEIGDTVICLGTIIQRGNL